MKAADVAGFLDLMRTLGVRIWIDGGWAVDALLEAQTRPHADLDIAIEERDVPAAVNALRERGYSDVPKDDTRPWNFVLGDEEGHEVDFHVISFDEQGDGIYGPPENGERYPAAALAGVCTIAGRTVACITPEWLVRFRLGYEPRAVDRADVAALCARFGIPLPDAYR
jgi:lincosamide nucleotidyltransferase A/C/D/E